MKNAAIAAASVMLVASACTSGETSTPPAPPETIAATSTAPSNGAATTTLPLTVRGATINAMPDPADSDEWEIEIVDRFPHDTEAFTQGLLVRDGVIYESTGGYGESTVRTIDRRTGAVIDEAPLDPAFYGEGLELVGDTLIQLTWQENTAFVWDAATLAERDTFTYEGEGWGLCNDGDRFVMSDGTSQLDFRDPGDFSLIGSVEVNRNGDPLPLLNELECVQGHVLSNVWKTDEIVVIDPGPGDVVATIDASELAEEVGLAGDTRAVLNGVAYDAESDTFLVTGKLWPTLFEVRFVETGE